jgi:hypothetical protein
MSVLAEKTFNNMLKFSDYFLIRLFLAKPFIVNFLILGLVRRPPVW